MKRQSKFKLGQKVRVIAPSADFYGEIIMLMFWKNPFLKTNGCDYKIEHSGTKEIYTVSESYISEI